MEKYLFGLYHFRPKTKGFTLVELLMVVFVLSIVAVTGASLFINSSSEVLYESRKNGFLKAYQNTITGVHMMMSLVNNFDGDNWESGWNMDVHPIVKNITGDWNDNGVGFGDTNEWRGVYPVYRSGEMCRILHYYVHSSLRQFFNNKGVKFTLSADIVGKNQRGIVVVCKACTGSNKEKEYFGDKLVKGDQNRDNFAGYPIYIDSNTNESLDKFWNFIANLDETTTLGQKGDSTTKAKWNEVKKKFK